RWQRSPAFCGTAATKRRWERRLKPWRIHWPGRGMRWNRRRTPSRPTWTAASWKRPGRTRRPHGRHWERRLRPCGPPPDTPPTRQRCWQSFWHRAETWRKRFGTRAGRWR
ncbi:HTH-type transcriptional regulator sinR, partial [Dysosmobacter welbionis]